MPRSSMPHPPRPGSPMHCSDPPVWKRRRRDAEAAEAEAAAAAEVEEAAEMVVEVAATWEAHLPLSLESPLQS